MSPEASESRTCGSCGSNYQGDRCPLCIKAVITSHIEELHQLIDAAVQMARRHGLERDVIKAIAEGHQKEEIDDDELKCRYDSLLSGIWALCGEADLKASLAATEPLPWMPWMKE